MGDRHAIAGTGQAQVFQGGTDLGGQARGILGSQARRQQAELAAAIACSQPGASLRQAGQAFEQFSDRADQGIGALTTQALVEAIQIVEPQHQQMPLTALFAD